EAAPVHLDGDRAGDERLRAGVGGGGGHRRRGGGGGGQQRRVDLLLQPLGGVLGLDEGRFGQQHHLGRNRRLDALDLEFAQGPQHPPAGGLPVGPPGD